MGALVDYELGIKSLKTKAKKVLPTEENKARVLAKHPQTKFLNDELDSGEVIKKPRK